jgi:hypothetical protein
MATYTVNYSNAENLAMSYVAADVDEWIQNAAHERARIAIEEIVKICVEKCLETNTQIPGSKDEMAELAFEQGWVIAAADRNTNIL